MRLLIFVFLITMIGCTGVSNPTPTKEPIIGSWKLITMTKAPVDIEKIQESKFMGGHLTFKLDETFTGEVIYPQSPDKTMKVTGTYKIEDGILIMSNHTNNSVTKSTLKFEKDFLIVSPLNPEALTAYYKRIN